MALHESQSLSFEMQLGTNHLGHFALTGRLLEAIRPDGRIVTVSSQAHRMGRMDFDDLMGERKYGAWRAYGQSKLANLLFMRGLAERLERAGSTVASVAAHPGYASTHLQAVGPEMRGQGWMTKVMGGVNKVMAQSAAKGALPTLYAATFPAIRSGDYVGPDGFGEQRGHRARDVGVVPDAPAGLKRLDGVAEVAHDLRNIGTGPLPAFNLQRRNAFTMQQWQKL